MAFRGLLGLYARYGPSIRSDTQGVLCRGASARMVANQSRPPATGPTDHCPGGTCTHEVIAPSGRTGRTQRRWTGAMTTALAKQVFAKFDNVYVYYNLAEFA